MRATFIFEFKAIQSNVDDYIPVDMVHVWMTIFSQAAHIHTCIVFPNFFVLHIHTSCYFLHVQVLFNIVMSRLLILVYGKLILRKACVY